MVQHTAFIGVLKVWADSKTNWQTIKNERLQFFIVVFGK